MEGPGRCLLDGTACCEPAHAGRGLDQRTLPGQALNDTWMREPTPGLHAYSSAPLDGIWPIGRSRA